MWFYRKISTLLLPILLTFSCKPAGEDAIYLVPEGFEGILFILFEENNGNERQYDSGQRVYLFDSTGILKTKFSPNYGRQKNTFYYFNREKARKIQLEYSANSEMTHPDSVVVFNKETGNYFDTKKSTTRHFEMITIAKEKNLEIINDKRSPLMWKITTDAN